MAVGEPEVPRPKAYEPAHLPPLWQRMRYCPAGKHYVPYLICPIHNVRTAEIKVFESPV